LRTPAGRLEAECGFEVFGKAADGCKFGVTGGLFAGLADEHRALAAPYEVGQSEFRHNASAADGAETRFGPLDQGDAVFAREDGVLLSFTYDLNVKDYETVRDGHIL